MNEATVEFLMSSNLLEPAFQFFDKLAPEGIGALRSRTTLGAHIPRRASDHLDGRPSLRASAPPTITSSKSAPSPRLIPFVRTPENSPNQTEYQQELLRLHTDENEIVE